MDTEMTYPHTFESGITIIRRSPRGAALITDGINVTWIQGGWIRVDGTLTNNGMKALLNATETVEDMEAEKKAYEEKKAAEKRAWEEKKEESKKLITVILEKGVLYSGGANAYKYVYGKGYNMYHHLVKHYNYIPKSLVTIERKNNKVYMTLPKWLAEKHQSICGTLA